MARFSLLKWINWLSAPLVVLVLGVVLGQDKNQVVFEFYPPDSVEISSVSVRGSFNNWGEAPMALGEDGVWSATLELPSGGIQYKYFINGEWPSDMCDDSKYGGPEIDIDLKECSTDGYGGQNAVRQIGEEAVAPTETDALNFQHDASKAVWVSRVGDGLSVRFSVNASQVKSAQILTDAAVPISVQLVSDGMEVWRAVLPKELKQYSLELTLTNGDKKTFGPYRTPEQEFTALEWVNTSVGYQIFPERFFNGDSGNDALALETSQAVYDQTWTGDKPYLSKWTDPPSEYQCCQQYFGGDLAGIEEKLGYLKNLGVDLIYLNPIFDSGSVHGYDTHDYLKVSPKFGDEAVLKSLLEGAHQMGMKVIFDFVPNHTGLGFWAFQDVVKNGRDSKYWDWYFIKEWPFTPGNGNQYTAWAGVGSLPKLNTGNPEVRKYLIDASVHWIDFGFDGIRVDVANEIINSKDFFSSWRTAIRNENPNAYLVAEIWSIDPTWLEGDQFDSLMNYALGRGGSPPTFGGILGFSSGAALQTGERAQADLARVYAHYPEAVAAMGFNLIDSHDTARLLTDLGGGLFGDTPTPESLQRLRLASAILYALPGASVFFQGDECGYLGEKGQWPINELYRYPLQWTDCNPETLEHFTLLGKLKKSVSAFKSPVFRTVMGEGSVLAFARGEPGVGEVLAAFNNAMAPTLLKLPEGKWQDAVSQQVFSGEVSLSAISWMYLERLP